MTQGRPVRDDAERAALAFSLLPVRFADAVSGHLSLVERQRLKANLARVRDVDDATRIDAVRALSAEVRRGVVFPRPSAHDERDCPFTPIADVPRQRVVEVLQRIAARDALEVAVTLCHLNDAVRGEIWDRLGDEARTLVQARLDEVHDVSRSLTRTYARDVETRMSRAARFAAREPSR